VERAERDVLTAVLSDTTGQHRDILDRFEPRDFTASPHHAVTWRAIQEVARRDEPVNIITVAREAECLPREHGPAMSAEALVDLAAAPAPDSLRRQTMTIVRASLYHRIQRAGDDSTVSPTTAPGASTTSSTRRRESPSTFREQATRLAGEHVRPAAAHQIAQRLDGVTAPRQR
jgi:hypothetical protein